MEIDKMVDCLVGDEGGFVFLLLYSLYSMMGHDRVSRDKIKLMFERKSIIILD